MIDGAGSMEGQEGGPEKKEGARARPGVVGRRGPQGPQGCWGSEAKEPGSVREREWPGS
ncbi:MAG: hypothetical protein QXD84_07215 [Thermoplasmata archaeon]